MDRFQVPPSPLFPVLTPEAQQEHPHHDLWNEECVKDALDWIELALHGGYEPDRRTRGLQIVRDGLTNRLIHMSVTEEAWTNECGYLALFDALAFINNALMVPTRLKRNLIRARRALMRLAPRNRGVDPQIYIEPPTAI